MTTALPDCAEGVVKDYPATITLTNPSDGRFTELTEDQSGPVGHTFVFAAARDVGSGHPRRMTKLVVRPIGSVRENGHGQNRRG